MPRLEGEGVGAFDVEDGNRLVLAMVEDADVDILHRGGPEPQNRVVVSGGARFPGLAALGRFYPRIDEGLEKPAFAVPSVTNQEG